MTDAQKELYEKTKARMRRLGIENPADVVVALTEEIDYYRGKIERLEKRNELLEGLIGNLREENNQLSKELLHEQMKPGDQYLRLTPTKPIEEADDFGDRSLCCPHCLGPVTNYWAPGTKPKHCQFCGQALDWGQEGKG